MAGCVRTKERREVLVRTLKALVHHLPKAEYIIGLDNTDESVTRNLFLELSTLWDSFTGERGGIEVYKHNEGLGHSWNWGMKQARREFVLQMEDDWEVLEQWNGGGENLTHEERGDFKEKLATAMDLCSDPFTFVRFDNVMQLNIHPKDRAYQPGGVEFNTCPNTGRTIYQIRKPDPRTWLNGFNYSFMSNRPQLKRKEFHEKVGRFLEMKDALKHTAVNPVLHTMRGRNLDGIDVRRELIPNTELDMGRVAISDPRVRGFTYDYGTFAHIGGECQAR